MSVSGIIDVLACPICGAPLAPAADGLTCERGHDNALRDGVPMPTPPGATFGRRDEWNRKQKASAPEYQAKVEYPEARRQAVVWTMGRLFGEFWTAFATGVTALDVGCGMYAEQAYFRPEWKGTRVERLVGVDPLFHSGPRDYDFGTGRGGAAALRERGVRHRRVRDLPRPHRRRRRRHA